MTTPDTQQQEGSGRHARVRHSLVTIVREWDASNPWMFTRITAFLHGTDAEAYLLTLPVDARYSAKLGWLDQHTGGIA